jgi:hypothetical protein
MAKGKKKATAEKEPVLDTARNPIGGGGNGEKITKADAVRNAIKEGVEKPQEAVEWIKTKYGIEISTGMFSNYKSVLGKKDAKAGSSNGAAKMGRPAKSGGSIDLAALEDVKELVNKLGAAQVIQIAKIFE